MCEFVSWIEWQGNLYYLTASDLRTKEGKELLKASVRDDMSGHGSILAYYPELHGHGHNMECTDFSSPSNFPEEIAGAIKAGKFRGIGYDDDLLTTLARNELKKIQETARAEYEKACGVFLAEYDKACGAAWADYDKACGAAWAEYNKEIDSPFWDLFSDPENRAEAWR